MSLLENLKPPSGSTGYRKRVGRGHGSGLGGTSGYGDKGQRARSGGKIRRGFEGGQTPLIRRLPKFGFSNKQFENRYQIVNIETLEKLGPEITPEKLLLHGFVKQGQVKILGKGSLKSALKVRAHKFSATAKSAIEKAGGVAEVISGNSR